MNIPNTASSAWAIVGLRKRFKLKKSQITTSEVLELVHEITGITPDKILSRRRTDELVYARHLTIYILRKHTNMTLKNIGDFLGRDHTSIIHAIRSVDTQLGSKFNSKYKFDVPLLTQAVHAWQSQLRLIND